MLFYVRTFFISVISHSLTPPTSFNIQIPNQHTIGAMQCYLSPTKLLLLSLQTQNLLRKSFLSHSACKRSLTSATDIYLTS